MHVLFGKGIKFEEFIKARKYGFNNINECSLSRMNLIQYNTKPKHADTHMFCEMRTCAIWWILSLFFCIIFLLLFMLCINVLLRLLIKINFHFGDGCFWNYKTERAEVIAICICDCYCYFQGGAQYINLFMMNEPI